MNKIVKLNDINDIQQAISDIIETKKIDVSDCENKILQDGSQWIKIFHHNHKNNTKWFATCIEALSCSDPDKFSKLYLLDHLRRNDGKYEFMLEYPAEFPNQIIRWKQTNNPWRDYNNSTGSTYEPVAGYEAIQIDIVDSVTNRGKGLVRHNAAYNTNDPCLLKGCNNTQNWWYGIGQKAVYNGGLTGPGSVVSIVDLWVRVDNTEFDNNNIFTVETHDLITKINIQKIQNTVNVLETSFTNNCCQSLNTLTCQSDKCESCQDSCTCQSNKCEKCQESCSCQSNKCEKCQESCSCQSSKCQSCQNTCNNCTNCGNQKCQNGCNCESCQANCCYDCDSDG